MLSAAVGVGGSVLAERATERFRSSEGLLGLIREVLAEAGLGLRDLGGLVGLRGPGSFTGLRVGLATLLGLHQALGTPATALGTLEALAASVEPGAGPALALVDARRGEWFAQRFLPGIAPVPLGPAALLADGEVSAAEAAVVVGFGVSRLHGALGPAPSSALPREAEPLARWAVRLAAARPPSWDPRLLSAPLYLQEPATAVSRLPR